MTALNSGLSETTCHQITQVLKRHPQVEKAILYGSRATGTYKTGSDIDLTLSGNQLTTALLATIYDELDELLLPYMIDLSILSGLKNEGLRDHIHRVGVVFYKKEA